MARAKKTAGPGHNLQLTDEERSALKFHYARKVTEQERLVEAAAKTVANERKALNGIFMSARGELGILRKDFEEDLRLMRMTPREFANHEAARSMRLKESGLTNGEQMDLPLGDTADDKAEAYQSGYMAGLRGDDPDCPDYIAAVLRADFEHGWGDGQAKLAEKLTMASSVLERIKATKPELEEEPDEDPEPEDEEEALDDEARKLKRAGWTQPTADETAFVEEMA